jgi:hypothetical protein
MTIVAPGKASVAWRQSEMVSFRRGRLVTNTWAEVGEYLTNQGYALGMLEQATERKEFDFELDFHQIPIPTDHLSKMRDAAELLSTEAIFNLRSGDPSAAATNLQTLLALANAGRDEPMAGSQIYRLNMIQKAVAVQWEWLQASNITDEQLAGLQVRWTNLDLVAPTEKAMEMTRATSSVTRNLMRAGTGPFASSGGGVGGMGRYSIGEFFQSLRHRVAEALWRESWSYDDELNMMEGEQVMIETLRQVETNGYFKDALAERERKISALGLDHTNANWLRTRLGTRYSEFGAQQIRGMAGGLDRVLATEAARQCAIAAIALKRYELRHGTLPKELGGLLPEFLAAVPHDPADGKPLRYRLNGDGTFRLYSVGTDGIDDGGDPMPVLAGNFYQWQPARDLVWPQPATPAEVQNYYDHPPK